MEYTTPEISEIGSVADLTQEGRPNQEFDFGSFTDFLGPKDPVS